jgi:hypothetical protein
VWPVTEIKLFALRKLRPTTRCCVRSPDKAVHMAPLKVDDSLSSAATRVSSAGINP